MQSHRCFLCHSRQVSSPIHRAADVADAISTLGETGKHNMQFQGELDMQASFGEAAASSSRKRRSSSTRKVTVRLTEALCERLEVATERPGVGKSMVVEAALERFLNPAASVEDLVQERFDDLYIRFDRLERDMRVMAETIALHARYHLAIMPPLPQSRQHEAVLLGDERFKVLAEQVDRRVRQCRPLMQETIDRLNSRDHGGLEPTTGEETLHDPEAGLNKQELGSEGVDIEHASSAAVEEDGSNPHFHHPSGAFCRRDAAENGEPNPQSAPANSDPQLTGNSEATQKRPLSKWRLIFSVFLPFAAGYFLSFLFRTINASIAPALVQEFALDAAETGLLASVYFLVFAAAQIPIGVLLDRYGPRRVQSVLLVIAVGGATLFGTADGFAELLIGRAMIGLGVAASLMAGLKAIVTWFPKERIALVNGCMIMLGSLGAVAATAPTDWLLNGIGWRSLFEVLTIATLATAGLIYFAVPERDTSPKRSATSGRRLTLGAIFSDPRFQRIAPLSATCIGSSWALQSLWAASWLADVEAFDRQSLINQLFTMAVGISLGAFLLGTMADRLRRRGIATEVLLAAVGGLFILAELALVMRVPVPSVLPWSVVSIVGAGTVLSYAIIAEYFPVEIAARANGALNLLHFSWAFVVQLGIGLVVGQWPPQDGHYPIAAYQAAFGLSLALHAAALLWFAIPWLGPLVKHLYNSLARQNPGRDTRAGFVAVPVEGAILEAYPAGEW
jgi:MFS family permease